jgi:hypothetical protein
VVLLNTIHPSSVNLYSLLLPKLFILLVPNLYIICALLSSQSGNATCGFNEFSLYSIKSNSALLTLDVVVHAAWIIVPFLTGITDPHPSSFKWFVLSFPPLEFNDNISFPSIKNLNVLSPLIFPLYPKYSPQSFLTSYTSYIVPTLGILSEKFGCDSVNIVPSITPPEPPSVLIMTSEPSGA